MLREAHEEADKKLHSNINIVKSSIYNMLVDMIYSHQTEKIIYDNTKPFLYKGIRYMSTPNEAHVVYFLDFLKQYHPHYYQDLKTSLEKEYIYLQESVVRMPELFYAIRPSLSQGLKCLTITINVPQ